MNTNFIVFGSTGMGMEPKSTVAAHALSTRPLIGIPRVKFYSLGMRRGSNYTSIALPTVLSTVGELDEPAPMLYRSLTDPEQTMPTLRCTVLRFPVIDEMTTRLQTSDSVASGKYFMYMIRLTQSATSRFCQNVFCVW